MKRMIAIGLSVFPALSWAFETQLQLYRPFTETPKHPPMRVERKQVGTCLESSWLSTRQEALRCLSQGRLYDPCFVNRFGDHKSVFCPSDPWLSQGVLLELETPLEENLGRQLDMSRDYPWAVELGRGLRCLAVAPGQEYDQLPIRYACNANTVLMGHMQRCSGRWKILQHSPQGVNRVEITQAWF